MGCGSDETQDAMSRLSGCDMQHLSLIEAKIIQALRYAGYTNAQLARLLIILMDDEQPAQQLKKLFGC